MCCVGEIIKKDRARLMIIGLNPTDSTQAYYTEFTNLWRCVCAGGPVKHNIIFRAAFWIWSWGILRKQKML